MALLSNRFFCQAMMLKEHPGSNVVKILALFSHSYVRLKRPLGIRLKRLYAVSNDGGLK
ncbi:MAG: hypothetical protein ACREIM_10480 [Nitrospiraceae bacterium]